MHPNAKGTFVGVSANHKRGHLLRAVYEGIAFCHKVHVDRLLRAKKEPFAGVRLAGGAARSKVWTQMFADILQMPVESVEANETGALGCAIAVAAAVGDYPSISDAIANMVRIGEAVMPREEYKEIYEKKYELYLKTADSLDGLWDSVQAMIEGRA